MFENIRIYENLFNHGWHAVLELEGVCYVVWFKDGIVYSNVGNG